MKYIVNKNEDNLWTVEDELGSVIEVMETRAAAREMVRQLMMPPSNVHHIEGTYGTETHGTETAENFTEKLIDQSTEQTTETVVVVGVAPESIDGKILRKSDQVRWRITIAKQNNESENDVVQWAVDHLGMKKPLARTYVKGNWHKA